MRRSRLITATILSLLLSNVIGTRAEESPLRTEVMTFLSRADSLVRADQPDSAVTVANRALGKAREAFGESDTTVAHTFSILGKCYFSKRDYPNAELLLKKAIESWDEINALEHPVAAAALHNLGTIYIRQDRLREAEPMFKQAIELRKRILRLNHSDTAKSLNNLAVVYMHQSQYAEAEPLYMEAIAIKGVTLGRSHESYATSLANLALVYQHLGKYSEAEPLLKESLEIIATTLGTNDKEFAWYLDKLAMLYFFQGKYAEAEPLAENALQIRETSFGASHRRVAESLNNLGLIYMKTERFEEAEALIKRAIEIRKGAGGKDYRRLASSLNNLASIYQVTDRLAESIPILQRALEIKEESVGLEHPLLASTLNNLGAVYMWLGRYDEAEPLLERGLEIREKALGPDHPSVGSSLTNLAKNHSARGQPDNALETYGRLQQSRENFIEYAFSYASEAQKMRYMEEHPLMEPSLFSFALKYGSPAGKRASLEMVLKGKAVVIDAVAAEKEAAYCSYNDEILLNLKKHSGICGDIAKLSLADIGSFEGGGYRDSLHTLYAIKDSLEAELSRECTDFKEELSLRRFEIEDVSQALPEGAVLWEFIRYEPYDFDATGSDREPTGSQRYLALTLDRSGAISLVELGAAALIDSIVSSSRKALHDAVEEVYGGSEIEAEEKLSDMTLQLYHLVFAPLRESLNGNKRIFISPDSELNLLPFEILSLPDGRYVIEEYTISYLSSGRDLLRYGRREKSGSDRALVIANPDFDLEENSDSDMGESNVRGLVDRSGCLDSPFNPLPATGGEGKQIARLLRERGNLEADHYEGPYASESSLKKIDKAPRALHLATHGYFCSKAGFEAPVGIDKNPLLYSGLIFAGANRVITPGEKKAANPSLAEDGILTSLEVSGLNLVGTELVVLSACETGVGEVKSGEGVYGLRRAFQHAGAQTVVMSLWDIPDRATVELMIRFYEKWLSGESKSDALRKAALKILSDRRDSRGCAHPLFWGGFVLVGNPN
jgi:CHAT domain-containing protein/tetratricopeptide (TPR) repeat protein